MIPTPTPAPPMPIQAMPAPMYFAAVGSMTKLLFEVVAIEPSVARVYRIVEIDAGENGEDVGLQESHQEFERGQHDHHGERQHRAEPAEHTRAGQHDDEAGKDLQRDMAGQHVGEQTYAVRDRPRHE